MADCGAWGSRLFRRPAFTPAGVSFGGCDRSVDANLAMAR